MQIFAKAEQAADPEGTVHVALLNGDGAIIIHEELPADEAPHRHHMLELQAELDVRDIPDATRRVYLGPTWPPAGHEMKKGKVVPLPMGEP